MSFATKVKEELANYSTNNPQARFSTLEAFLRLNSEIHLNTSKTITFASQLISVCNLFSSFISEFFKSEFLLKEEKVTYLNKPSFYIVEITSECDTIIEEFDLLRSTSSNKEAILLDEDAMKAYLRGAFLTKGSINDPEKPYYHLEIRTTNEIEAVYIQKLMNYFDLNAKIAKRRNELVIYLKDIQMIIDFLRIIGASKIVFEIESAVVEKKVKGNIKRVMNFETANDTRAMIAAKEQYEHCTFIHNNNVLFDKLDKKLQIVIKARIENEHENISELIDYIKRVNKEVISKSCINHRFRKIKEISLEHLKGKRK